MSDILIEFDKVYKKYCRDLNRSMLYGLQDIALDIFNIDAGGPRLRDAEFMALNDISLKVSRGEALGIIGTNGAGKSTVLKLISGVILPDSGSVKTRGKVGELIEITAGFHPMLTGRENIYVKAAILGMGKKEIDRVFDEIVGFAELGSFIDTPVKYYSSGMHMRLGFSVIVHSMPDILAVDEILSVGDAGFRAKCFNRINELVSQAGVIFVSHNMADIARICSKIMVLNRGECIFYGDDVMRGIDRYYRECPAGYSPAVSGSGKAVLHDIAVDTAGRTAFLDTADDLVLRLSVRLLEKIPGMEIVITVSDFAQQGIIQANSYFDEMRLAGDAEWYRISVCMGPLHLNPGVYAVSVNIRREQGGEVLGKYSNCLTFHVTGRRTGYSPVQLPAKWDVRERR